jgi:hypothetical protein
MESPSEHPRRETSERTRLLGNICTSSILAIHSVNHVTSSATRVGHVSAEFCTSVSTGTIVGTDMYMAIPPGYSGKGKDSSKYCLRLINNLYGQNKPDEYGTIT